MRPRGLTLCDQSMPSTWLLVLLVHAVGSADGRRDTGVRASSSADVVHSDVRRWAEPQREWQPSHSADVQVMGLDRHMGAVVGYNTRTGKVFAQRGALPGPSPLYFAEGAVMEVGRDCALLTKVSATEYAWSAAVEADRAQMWTVDYGVGWMDEARHVMLTSREAGETCKCQLARVADEWRASGVRTLGAGGCEPWQARIGLEPGHATLIPEEHHLSREERAAECTAMGYALTGVSFAGMHVEQTEPGPNDSRPSCANLTRVAIMQLHRSAAVRNPLSAPRESRGKVMRDAKHVAQLLDALDAPLALITKSLEMLAQQFRAMLGDKLKALHDHDMLTHEERSRKAMADEHVEGMTARYPGSCDAASDPLVQKLLETRVTLTPQASNTTRVTLSLGRYALDYMVCLNAQLAAVSRSMVCVAEALEIRDSDPEPVNQATEADVLAAVEALRGALHPSRRSRVVRAGGQVDDLADQIVKVAVDAAEATYRRLAKVAREYTAVAEGWAPFEGKELVSGMAEDTWCCLAEHLLQDSRYPKCERRAVRTFRRLMEQRDPRV